MKQRCFCVVAIIEQTEQDSALDPTLSKTSFQIMHAVF